MGSVGSNDRSRGKPKLAIARAAAPILRGLRGETRTMSMRSIGTEMPFNSGK